MGDGFYWMAELQPDWPFMVRIVKSSGQTWPCSEILGRDLKALDFLVSPVSLCFALQNMWILTFWEVLQKWIPLNPSGDSILLSKGRAK